MKLPDSFLDELRARAGLVALVGRKTRLTRSGRNWKACCPFHSEKTPSFYVYEDGFHCFGCGAHGDAISFVMQTQGASFMEAVEQLAGECGLDLPKPEAHEQARAEETLALREILGEAAAFYAEQLWSPRGAAALAYLRGRGLTDETIRAFRLGWSGEGRGGLARRLGTRAEPAGLLAVGLLRAQEDGSPGGELFFNRVMFPIRDRRGAVVGFGGRTLGEGQPKYVNSPETTLFSKRRLLYGLDVARAGVREGAAVVAVEGYMDVIALHQAGFAGAVAPLGTALGPEQLELLWGLAPAPVLCFDGDAAGARAAARVIEVALPLVTAARTLRFATLPSGEDPDSLLRARGAEGFLPVLEAARPFSAALFASREDIARREAASLGPAERRGRLRALLDAATAGIADRALRTEYRRHFNDLLFAPRPGGRPAARPVPLPRPEARAAIAQRGEILLAIAVAHPAILGAIEEAFAGLALPPAWAGVRDATMAWAERAELLDSQALANHLANLGMTSELDRLRAVLPARATAERAEACWWHFFGLITHGALERQVAAAREACVSAPSDASFARLAALTAELARARRGELHAEVFDD